ncbi:uncharacterized protein LOC144807908 [Lissotriton helveticus]
MTPLMQRIIAVTHPELAERLSADRQQTSALTEDTQPQTVESSRGNESGSDFAHTQTDTEEASAGEGDRTVPEDSHVETPSSSSSDTLGEPALLSQTGSGHSPPSVVRQHTGPTLPPTAPCTVRGRRSRGSRVAFGAGTAAPATVSQNALCAEAVDLLRQLCVGQTNMTNAFQDHDRKLGQVVAFMEGMHGDLAGLHRTVQSLASSVSSAIVQSNEQGATCVSPSTPLDVSGGSDYSEQDSNTAYCTRSSVRQHVRARRAQTPSPRSAKSVHVDDVRCTGVHTQDPQVLLGDMPSGATQPFNTKGTPKARDSHMSMDCSLDKASQKTKAPTKSRETPKSRPTAEYKECEAVFLQVTINFKPSLKLCKPRGAHLHFTNIKAPTKTRDIASNSRISSMEIEDEDLSGDGGSCLERFGETTAKREALEDIAGAEEDRLEVTPAIGRAARDVPAEEEEIELCEFFKGGKMNLEKKDEINSELQELTTQKKKSNSSGFVVLYRLSPQTAPRSTEVSCT